MRNETFWNFAALLFVLAAGIAYLIAIRIRGRHQSPTRRAFVGRARFAGITVEGVINKMELREGQKVELEVSLQTARGNAAAIEPGSAVWGSSDESVVAVVVDPDNELKATAEAIDGSANDSVVVEFRADGKRGEGVREVIATLDLVATQGDAVVASITAGTPIDPETEPAEPTPGEPGPGEGGPTEPGFEPGDGGDPDTTPTEPVDGPEPAG